MKYRSVYTKTIMNEYGIDNSIELNRRNMVKKLNNGTTIYCQVHYEDGNGKSTAKQDIILKPNSNVKGYIVSENIKGETIGTLTINSFLKGNDTKLIFGKKSCGSIDQRIQKRLQAPTKEQAMEGLKVFRDYLNSLDL